VTLIKQINAQTGQFAKPVKTLCYVDMTIVCQDPLWHEVLQLFTPWSHPGSCWPRPLLNGHLAKVTLAIAHQDPLWHKGFSALYSILTPRQLPSKPFRCIDTLTLAIACKIHHDMEVFQPFTTFSHPGSCPPRPSAGPLYQHLDDPGNCL